MKRLPLYIHIPYCLEKCPYCDFHSVAVERKEIPQETYAKRLAEQFAWEIQRFGLHDRKLVSIFFGGGTPSLMGAEFFEKFLDAIKGTFPPVAGERPRGGPSPIIEVTVETNPRTADKRRFKEWLALGINRISFGTQSFQDSLLQRLGRHHTAADSFRAVEEALEAGFTNISCDLIFGIKDQTLKELEFDLKTILEFKIPHASCYQLTVEKNTPLWSWVNEGIYRLPDEEKLVALHERTAAMMETGGLARYEISNYARAGFEARHNLEYWRCNDYLGIGSGAVSKIGDRRFRTTKKLKNYLAGDWSYEEEETIDSKTAWKEKWMMGLRLKEGVVLEEREKRLLPFLAEMEVEGFLTKRDRTIALTSKGFLVCNALLRKIFDCI